MLLKDISTNSKYLTDETINSTLLVAITNGAIAYINSEIKCNLPFVTSDNVETTEYDAVSDSWQLRLFEPFLCFSIFSNESSDKVSQFHYSRFIDALKSFESKGLDSIKTEDDEGEDTGYIGDSGRIHEVDLSEVYITGWWE